MPDKFSEVSESHFAKLKRTLEKEQWLSFKIASGSMEPVIMTGDFIAVEPLSGPPSRYDILVYWSELQRILICHYLWHINVLPGLDGLPVYVTRPLLHVYDDYPISEKHILGRVVNFRLSRWRKIQIFFKVFFHSKKNGILG